MRFVLRAVGGPRPFWTHWRGRERVAASFQRKFLAATFILAGAIAPVMLNPNLAAAQESTSWQSESGDVVHAVVTVNKSRTYKLRQPFEKAVVGEPSVADVLPLTDNSLYVQGKKVGTTNVSVFDSNKRLIGVLDLEVTPDTGTLRDKIQASTGSGNIRVGNSNGQVVLSGEASDAVAAARAVNLAKGLVPEAAVVDAMKIQESQQVMLKVRFLEVSREAANAFGINISVLKGGKEIAATGTGIGATSFPAVAGSLAGAASSSTPFGVAVATLVNHGTSIDALISALETKSLVRRLAEPELVAMSGDTASFLAGGEFPVPAPQPGSSGSGTTITVSYKQYGVQLAFSPTVLANGLINLRLAPTVSEIDTTNAIEISGFSIPAITEREAKTTVELRDGQSFAIAGLLQTTNAANINQVPWLGSLPVLGALFRSSAYQKNETELIVVVTPHLVKPMAPGSRVATPFDDRMPGNDIDVFALGLMERKKSYAEYVTKGGDVQGPYGDIIGDQSAESYVNKK